MTTACFILFGVLIGIIIFQHYYWRLQVMNLEEEGIFYGRCAEEAVEYLQDHSIHSGDIPERLHCLVTLLEENE